MAIAKVYFSLSIDVFNQSSAMKTNTLIFLITLGFSLLAEASDNVLDKVLEKLGASETVDVSKTIDWGYSLDHLLILSKA